MAFAVRGASLLRAPAGGARLSAAPRRGMQPRTALRARAALPSPTQVDGLIGLALCPFALQVASVSLDAAVGGGLGSLAAAVGAAASVRSVPLALSVLVGGVLTLERDAVAAKLASPSGGVVRSLVALVAAAVAFGFIYATQVPLGAAALANKAMSAMLEPSVPLALTALGLALTGLEGGPLLRKWGPKIGAALPDLVAGALVALVAVKFAVGPAALLARDLAASLTPPPPPPVVAPPVLELEAAHAAHAAVAGAHAAPVHAAPVHAVAV